MNIDVNSFILILILLFVFIAECIVTGLGIALTMVGIQLKKSNSLVDKLEVNLSIFSGEYIHYIDKRDLQEK